MVGQRAFEALHMLIRMQAGAECGGGDGGAGGGGGAGNGGAGDALRASVLRIIPESKLDVLPLMFRLLYAEGQLEG
ncbi:hypothetical protein MNEG_9513 [Monoraphidium neglectum]|uniref:Uncharacterized protein n=1 Tax=Monoraphidium neglectum TaxID=145388 RepID=A0A0D2MC97_9CHLO|nr:hypothetical protein MNEG_9513 [Monoraphidium neglectum]KIY98451.1 hypothetical protein MNEG_9513 [Monoraphidium neglectum]|eukprot:XP_013897471.1 hypothetical protein MNEG_9513 [Monoraphidium neglectum]